MMKRLQISRGASTVYAVQAELDDAKTAQGLNNKPWRLVKKKSFGACMKSAADQERYVLLLQDMSIETTY
jgi:hypothetical protein